MTLPVGPPPPGRDAAARGARPAAPRVALHVPANLLVLGWFVAAGAVAVAHRFVPVAGWLMVHLLLLGGVSTAILLWSQHFAETLLRTPTPGGRRGLWARLLGWSASATTVVAGMVTGTTALVVAGAAGCGAVAVAHVVVLVVQGSGQARTFGNRYAHLVRYYLVATALLPVGVALGVVLARSDPSPGAAGRLYLAHVAVTLLGWVGLTVAGTVVLLWPTVLHTRIDPPADRAGRRALVVLGAGLALYVAGPATGWRWLTLAGAGVVAGGVVLLGVHVVRQARAVARAGTSGGGFAAWSIAAALAWFVVSVVASGVAVLRAPSWAAVPVAFGELVGPFAVGFVAQVMVGSMSYLLPVVLGGGPGAVRWSNAAVARWGPARVVVLNACVALFALPLPSWVAVTVSMLGLAVLVVFLVLAVRVVLVQRGARRRTLTVEQAADARGPVPLAGVAVGAAAVALVVVGGVAVDPAAAGLTSVPASAAPATSDAPTGTGTGTGTGETVTVTVVMEGMRFAPDVVEVPAGSALVVDLVNADDQVHDLVLEDGTSSGRLAPGGSATVDVGVVTADLDGWCSVAGHRLMGMTLTVVATGEADLAADETSATEAEAGDGTGHDRSAAHGPSDAAPSAARDLDLGGEAPEGFVARDATLPPIGSPQGPDDETLPDPDGTGALHRITLTVGEADVEVSPGVVQRLWTFDGTAPGPTLRGAVGDTFEVTLVNDGTIGHSIDFHAGALAPDEPMRTIAPGEELTYTFRAERSGIWMYHCSTMPMSLHIANGMFGAVVVDPPGLAPVDREYVLVQSELYLGPQSEPADPARIATQDPDLVVFNGYAEQYRFSPLEARVGETVRFWVLDAGPNRPSSFHVVGGQFDTVFAEGGFTLRDGGPTGTGGAQALGLQPAQGGFVELTFPEAGTYPFVTHVMSDAEKGAGGRVLVTP